MNKCIIFLLFVSGPVNANLPLQNTYTLSDNYTVTIHGSSTVSNWQDVVGKVTGDMVANVNDDGSMDLNAIHMKMYVRSIKSNMGPGMDRKTYNALKGDINPEIIFILDVPIKLMQVYSAKKAFFIKGNLTLAGINRQVIMQATLCTSGPGKLAFEGSQQIKMTDYGVRPPTALFGTIRVNPDITINFKTNFTNKQN